MKRVVITGATGFIGANLSYRLLQEGHTLHLFVSEDFTKWRIESLCDDVNLHKIDFQNKDDLRNTIKKIQPDWVFHLAAYGSRPTQFDLTQTVQTNISGTINFVEACVENGFEVFVNTGSSSEYGFKDHAPSEKERLDPNSYYALTKAFATLFCRHMAQRFHLCISTLRLYSVYGPYEDPARLIPKLILCGLKGELPPLVSPNVAHDFIHVDDVIDAYMLAAENRQQEQGAVYNVGTGRQVLMHQVVDIARRVMNIPKEPEWGSMGNRNWDTHTWVADNRLIKKKLDWYPRYDFESGFRQTHAWFQDNPNLLDIYKQVISG